VTPDEWQPVCRERSREAREVDRVMAAERRCLSPAELEAAKLRREMLADLFGDDRPAPFREAV
jgi:hypothetical protein